MGTQHNTKPSMDNTSPALPGPFFCLTGWGWKAAACAGVALTNRSQKQALFNVLFLAIEIWLFPMPNNRLRQPCEPQP